MITEANRKWWILAAAGSSLAIVLLDEIFIGVALPTIRDELGLSQLTAQWVVSSYVLALAASVAVAGRLGDLLGHGRVFIAGGVILLIATAAGGAAESGSWLIVARAAQGVGTAALLSLGIAMIGIAFSENERGQAVGIWGLMGAAPSAFAPIVGGVLTDVASWRWIFFVLLPLIVVVIAIMALAWREPERAAKRKTFDSTGFALLLLFVIPLVLALMQAPEWGWGSPSVITLIVVAGVALAAFVRVETRSSSPLIDLRLLRRPTVLGADLVIFCAQFTKLAILIFGALFLQDILGLSALQAGFALLAAIAPSVLTAVWAGRSADRYGSRGPMLAGVAGTGIALVWISLATFGESYALLVPGLVLWGIALPFLFNPAYTAVMNSVAPETRGQAAGVATTGRQLGGVLAVALLGAVLIGTDDFALVFALSAAVTFAVGVAAYFLVEHRPAPAQA